MAEDLTRLKHTTEIRGFVRRKLDGAVGERSCGFEGVL